MLEQPMQFFLLAHVRRNDARPGSDPFRRFLQLCPAASRKDHLCAEPSELDRNGSSDAPSGAGHDRNLILNRHRLELIPRDTDFLVLVLQLIKLVINSPLRQQLLMRADLTDAALMHDDDLVASLDCRKPVRNDD